ncbi:MAG TPA: hypothetical protein VIY27_11355 [Myxococcota bacterium]
MQAIDTFDACYQPRVDGTRVVYELVALPDPGSAMEQDDRLMSAIEIVGATRLIMASEARTRRATEARRKAKAESLRHG